MKCDNCNVSIETGLSFYPIEPKGTKNRKWKCENCIKKFEYENGKLVLNTTEPPKHLFK